MRTISFVAAMVLCQVANAASNYPKSRSESAVFFADGTMVTKNNVYFQNRVPLDYFDEQPVRSGRPFHLVVPAKGKPYMSNRRPGD